MAEKPTTPEKSKYDLSAEDVFNIMKAMVMDDKSEEDATFLDENKPTILDFIENIFLPLYQNEVKKAEAAGEETTISILYQRTSRQLTKHFDAYMQAKAEYMQAKEGGLIPSIFADPLKKTNYNIDKLNKSMWGKLEANDNGQWAYNFDVSKKGSGDNAIVQYNLDFSGLEDISITRKLEPYDKRVEMAVGSLYNNGHPLQNLQLIYHSMGYKGNIGNQDKKRLYTSIKKMRGAQLAIDNTEEANVYNRELQTYEGSLLPIETITKGKAKGQITDMIIHVLAEPPMTRFARKRKQFTTIDVKLLDTPLSKTNANIELEDYLIEEIISIKKGNRNPKMNLETIYENTHITTSQQKNRAPKKIAKILDHYRKHAFINDYTPHKKKGKIEKLTDIERTAEAIKKAGSITIIIDQEK